MQSAPPQVGKDYPLTSVLRGVDRRKADFRLLSREANTLAGWLREHPGVTVIARDRAGACAKGARDGAPGAAQVADRFHLLQNRAETLELVFTAHAGALRNAEQARREAMLTERGAVPILGPVREHPETPDRVRPGMARTLPREWQPLT